MHPVKRLQQILGQPATPRQGKIVSVSSDQITVATAQGVRTVSRLPGDTGVYKAGDTVRLAGDTVLGKQAQGQAIYIV